MRAAKQKPEPYPTVEAFPDFIKPAPPKPPRNYVEREDKKAKPLQYCDVCNERLAYRFVIWWGAAKQREQIPGKFCGSGCARHRARRMGREP